MNPGIIMVGLGLLLASFVKGTTGMGFPLIATPVVALVVDMRTTVGLLLVPNILMDLVQITRGSFPLDHLKRLASLLLLGIVGVVLGTKILVSVAPRIINLTLAVAVFAFVLSQVLRLRPFIPPAWEQILSPIVGLIGGVLNGMANVVSPAVAIYFYCLDLKKRDFIKSISLVFFFLKIAQLASAYAWNILTPAILERSLYLTALMAVGFWAGLKVQDRINQATFNRGILILLAVTAASLFYKALK